MVYATAVGTAIARGGRVHPWLFDGMVESAEEAKDLAFQVNQRRAEQKAEQKAKLGALGFMGAK